MNDLYKLGRQRTQRPQQHISVRERTPKLPSARTLSTEDSINSTRRCRCSRPVLQQQRSSTSSNSRRNLGPEASSIRERRKSLQRLHSAKAAVEEVHVEVEVVQDSIVGLRQQLTSDGDDTLNNIRVPSLERDEEAGLQRAEVSLGSHDP